jgi:hypothetical protein
MKLALTILLIGWSCFAHSQILNFDDLKAGETLKGFEQGFYGPKGNLIWTVEADSSARSRPHVLKQTGRATYGWLVKKEPGFADGSIEADLKVISGKEDPEVGLVWRHKDGKNYYYARLNAVEDNVIFYRMNNGKKELVKEADAKIGFNNWHHLKVQFKGEQVEIFLDQKPMISIRDIAIKEAGRAGLFTTADSIGAFDNVSWSPAK